MSLFKRLFGFDAQLPQNDTSDSRSDVQPLGQYLQQKFSRGVNYNMKIVIRGDRTTGKTALFNRIKGLEFDEKYVATNEIQVASVHWNYKDSGDVIKVEVWDVVDKGKPRKPGSKGLKLTNTVLPDQLEPCLDASFLDVYKGTHGVILVMDMTKSWTFAYVRRELPRVPPHLPVLVLASHRDMGDKRTVTEEQVRAFLEQEAEGQVVSGDVSIPKPSKRLFRVQYCEASMRNGFGLRYVHKFFSLPFLCIQNSVLRQQLARNEMETSYVIAELETAGNAICTSGAAYEAYVQVRKEKERLCMNRHVESASPPISTDLTPQHSSTNPVQGATVQTTAELHHTRVCASDALLGSAASSTTETGIQHSSDLSHRTKRRSSETIPEDKDAFILVGHTRVVHPNTLRHSGSSATPLVLELQEEVDPKDVICAPAATVLSSLDSLEFSEEVADEDSGTQGHSGQLNLASLDSNVPLTSDIFVPLSSQTSLQAASVAGYSDEESEGDLSHVHQDEPAGRKYSGNQTASTTSRGDGYLVHGSYGGDEDLAPSTPMLSRNQLSGSTKPPTSSIQSVPFHDVFEDKADSAIEAVVQAVVNSAEDTDALERFLSDS